MSVMEETSRFRSDWLFKYFFINFFLFDFDAKLFDFNFSLLKKYIFLNFNIISTEMYTIYNENYN